MTRMCLDCSAAITRQSKTGRCKPCATRITRANPAREEKRKLAHREACKDPAYRAKMRSARARVEAERRGDPVWQAYKHAAGKRLRADYDARPDAQAKSLAKRGLVGQKLHQRALAWCPPDRRAEYTRLRERIGAPEARRQIEATFNSFDRQMARLAAGARLVAKPDTRSTADLPFTLGGIATGMI